MDTTGTTGADWRKPSFLLHSGDKSTQIDHVVISNFGIFVIETKNYKGWIIGDEYSDYWTQVIYKRKEKLYNPIRQNYGHIQCLKEYLSDYPGIPFIPIIAFTTKAYLKVTAAVDIVYSVNIVKTIKKYTTEAISDDVRDAIIANLSFRNITDKAERKKHFESIQNKKTAIRRKLDNNICPKCGSTLVLRRGSYGSFLGCSRYPKCRFTLSWTHYHKCYFDDY